VQSCASDLDVDHCRFLRERDVDREFPCVGRQRAPVPRAHVMDELTATATATLVGVSVAAVVLGPTLQQFCGISWRGAEALRPDVGVPDDDAVRPELLGRGRRVARREPRVRAWGWLRAVARCLGCSRRRRHADPDVVLGHVGPLLRREALDEEAGSLTGDARSPARRETLSRALVQVAARIAGDVIDERHAPRSSEQIRGQRTTSSRSTAARPGIVTCPRRVPERRSPRSRRPHRRLRPTPARGASTEGA
jgi:hypothetical protein